MSPVKIGIAVGGVVVAGLLIWLLVGVFSRITVTVNGEEVTLGGGSTVQTILDKELAKPQPGDLLDVDGKVLTTGGGEVCSATIDGQKAELNTPLTAGSEITIEDGEDLTEDAEVTEEVIEPKKDEGNRDFEAYWFGSIHLLSDGEEGLETTKTGKVSGKTITEVTKEPIDAGYRIYTAKPDDKVIALTFDDGPWPETTDQILDILEQYGAKATFFTIGSQIANTPDAVKRADALGCQVLTHSWDHAEGSGGGTSLAVMSSSEQIEEIEKGYKAIADVLGKEPAHILRAPGGNFYGDIIENVWKIVDAEIGWDVDTEDWSRPGADSIRDTILSAKSGQVVLMHDGGGDRSQTVEALRQAMPTLVEQGYKFITIDELLAYGMPSSKSDIPTTTGDSTSSTDTTSSTSSTSSTSTTGTSSSSANSSDESTASGSSSSTGSSSTGSSSSSSDSSSGTGSSTGSSNSSSDSSSSMGSSTAYTQ